MSRQPAYVRDGIVLGAAVSLFAVSFGVLATASGLSVAKTCAMSLLVFTGASQFAAVAVVDAGGSTGAAIGSALLLAARNAAYGLAMAPILGGGRLRRAALAQVIVDESAGMATAQAERRDGERAFYITGIALFVFWNIGTAVGALAGTALGDPETLGLDAAFPAGFLALLAPHLRRPGGRVAAVGGGAIALALLPFAPAGVPVIAASLAALPALAVSRR